MLGTGVKKIVCYVGMNVVMYFGNVQHSIVVLELPFAEFTGKSWRTL